MILHSSIKSSFPVSLRPRHLIQAKVDSAAADVAWLMRRAFVISRVRCGMHRKLATELEKFLNLV